MSQKHLAELGGYLRLHWRRLGLIGGGAIAVLLIIVQLLFPWGAMPLYQTIDGVTVSGWSAQDTKKMLEERYQNKQIGLYFGSSPKPYREPKTADIGMTITSDEQVRSAQYSWWLRLIPTSLWWAHAVVTAESPNYDYNSQEAKNYIAKELGESCRVTPQNASLEYKDKKLRVIPAIDGGTCELADVERILISAKPTLTDNDIRIPMEERPAKIDDDMAKAYANTLRRQIEGGVTIDAVGQKVTAPQTEVLSWIEFTAPDSGIEATVSSQKAKPFFDKQLAPKIVIAPGTSKVTTRDFEKIAETIGSSGRALDVDGTVSALNEWLQDPGGIVTAKSKTVAPNVSYTRTYTPTDTGIAALITQFAEAHPGTYGVSFAELDGKRRHASYQSDKVFRTASTYKLFVAYGALKRVESGAWHWTDQIHGGRTLRKCLDDMIVKSDNPCGETMLEKIGYRTLTNELRGIGLTKSSFLNSFPETTAGDLTMFVGALQSGQLLSAENTATLLSAMKRNIYRQGIPAGANGQTADKVGFLDGFLHDAAIVYGPHGTYALSIMSEGSSWGTLAELTREIEKLRVQG
jgi:beta-lactamase class A